MVSDLKNKDIDCGCSILTLIKQTNSHFKAEGQIKLSIKIQGQGFYNTYIKGIFGLKQKKIIELTKETSSIQVKDI